MVDRLPEFQGPKYRGSFRRGDFADFHQRFSLVPRRCAGKYPPAAPKDREHQEEVLDEALKNTFPASDPVSMEQPLNHKDLILDQFTRQAMPFSTASPITDAAALKLIVETSGAKRPNCARRCLRWRRGRVCLAPCVKHVTGIDMTPAMLARSAEYAKELGLTNLTWQQGDVTSLPFRGWRVFHCVHALLVPPFS